jgi:hypothetical protein
LAGKFSEESLGCNSFLGVNISLLEHEKSLKNIATYYLFEIKFSLIAKISEISLQRERDGTAYAVLNQLWSMWF